MNADALALDALIDAIVSGERVAPERFGRLASSEDARRLAEDLQVVATIAELGRDTMLPAEAGASARIGRFELGSPLGAGGMGTVWEARDTTLERTVAIKFLHPHLSGDARYRERFLREGRAAARLRHRGICAIYEVGEIPEALSLVQRGQLFELAAGSPYAAIELVRGETLQRHLRRVGRMPAREVLRIATEAADALAAAHEVGIVHRDIKPANIMLGSDGRVVLLDFGLAGMDASSEPASPVADVVSPIASGLTMAGDIVGTIAYMSPEQARGDRIDARTDVFSLGLVIWEMLTGTSVDTDPSAGRKSALTQRATRTEFIPDRTPAPKAWRRTLQRCLAADASDRYPSAKELLVDLQAQVRSSRRALALPLASGLALAALSLGAWVVTTGSRPSSKPEPVQKQLTSNPPENGVHTASISPDGSHLAFADPTGTYVRVIQTGETGRILAPETLDVTSVEWFPDGTRLAATAISPAEQGVSVWTFSIDGGTPHKLRDNAIAGPISSDGSKLAFVNLEMRSQNWIKNGMWIMGTDGADAHEVLPQLDKIDYQSVAWSPDGTKLLFVRGGDTGGGLQAILGISDLSGAEPTVVLSDPRLLSASCSSNCSWLRDGRIVFTLSEPTPNQAFANFWELRIDPKTYKASGSPRRLTNGADSCISNMDLPPDGSHLAFLKQRRQSDVYLGDLQDGGDRLESVRRLTLDDRDDHASTWTRDGRALYFASNRHGTFDVFRQGIDDQAAEAIVQGPGSERGAQLSPDGSFLIYRARPSGDGSGPDRLMRMPVGGGAAAEILASDEIAGYACPRVPTSSCVLKKFHDGELSFFQLDPLRGLGREIGRIRTSFPVWSLSPDGSRIALIGDGSDTTIPTKGVLAMRVDDGAIEDLHVQGLAFPNDLTWSSDGRSLFFTEVVTEEVPPGWRVVHADLAGHVRVLWHSNIVWGGFSNPQASPDGRHLAFEQVKFESNAWTLENF